MTDTGKQQLLAAYKTSEGIDIIFLQEGAKGFDNDEDESYGGGSGFMLMGGHNAEEALKAAFKDAVMIWSVGGVSRSAYYNVVAAGGVFAKLDELLVMSYTSTQGVEDWIKKPVKDTLLRRDLLSGKKLVYTKGVGRQRSGFENGGNQKVKDIIDKYIVRPTQTRVNLLGYRRPKAVTVNGGATRIYYWHAPLGHEMTLDSVGFGAYQAIRGEGSGGEVAVAANILFAMHLGITAAFPVDTILVGDLNISAAAVADIYKTTNVLSSADGWCHAIAHPSLPLTLVSSTLDQTALGYSDHAPIVFTIP